MLDSVPGVSVEKVFGCNFAVCGCISLVFSGWFFTCKPRPAVQEYGEGEHDLYGGDAQVSGWPTLMGVLHWEPEVMDFFPPGWL